MALDPSREGPEGPVGRFDYSETHFSAIESASAAEAAASATEPGTLTDGTYTASGKGFDGEVPVTVTIAGGKIASVTVGYNYATSGIGLMAINQLPAKIVAANGTGGVDVVRPSSRPSTAALSRLLPRHMSSSFEPRRL